MHYGLTEKEFNFLLDTVILPIKKFGAKVYLFGSRANGKFKKFSDIDILYVAEKNNPIPLSTITQINIAIEDSSFPFKIDLVSSNELAQSYAENIAREKIEL